MNIHTPKSVMVLFIGMAAIAIAANFLKGAEAGGATQIAPGVVVPHSEQTFATTPPPATPTTTIQKQIPTPTQISSQVQPSSSAPAATIAPPNITPRREQESRDDD
jgi:hypothetical protein